IAKNGEVIWKKKLNDEELASWNKKLQSWKEITGRKETDSIFKNFPFSAKYIMTDDSSFQKIQGKLVQPFRICLSEKNRKASSRFCSTRAIVKSGRLIFSKLQ